MRFFATTAKAMEPLLASELRALGAADVQETVAGAHFSGELETAYRACLESRIANRVLLPLKTFPAPTVEKLYGGVKAIRWSEHLTPKNTIAVDFSSSRSAITHTRFGALKVKDAICDQLRSVQGERPSVDTSKPDIRVNVYVSKDEATLSLDLSGNSLHQRGYREQGVAAPLKENLAAAMLMLAGWPELLEQSRAEGGEPIGLVDPMCGSGTLPLEASLMAARIPPGIHRSYYGFLGWKGHRPEVWERVLRAAKSRIIADPQEIKRLPAIVGFDGDASAIHVAIGNGEKMEAKQRVHFEKRELALCEPPPALRRGIVIVNPPYGERLGEAEELKGLYHRIGDVFKKKFQGWDGFVLTSNPDLAKSIGLRASRRHVLFNGPLECRLLKFELYSGSR